jgi:hypothetical protein
VRPVRPASLGEVSAYYLIGELSRAAEQRVLLPDCLLELLGQAHQSSEEKLRSALADLQRMVDACEQGCAPPPLTQVRANGAEPALRSVCRILLREVRRHAWFYQQLYDSNLIWSVVEIPSTDISVMPMGEQPNQWDYPTLDALAQSSRKRVELDRPMPLPRAILVQGCYHNRWFHAAIADGAHRALALVRTGARDLECYYGQPRVSKGHTAPP